MVTKSENKKGQVLFGAIIAGAVVVMLVLLSGLDTVEPSSKGVLVEFGKIKGTQNPGMEWTGVFTDLYTYDLKLRKMEVNMNNKSAAVDKSGMPIYATIQVNYRFKGNSAQKAYEEIGRDDELESNLNINGVIEESFKTVTSKYDTLEIISNREKVKQEAIELMKKTFPQDYFVLENVVVSNIDYDERFKSAILKQKENERLEQAAKAKVEVEKQNANIQIEKARGQSESSKLKAEAEAYQVKVKAEAEAEALRLKRQELTPLMVENNRVDAWRAGGSQVPQYMMGGNVDFLMQMTGGNK